MAQGRSTKIIPMIEWIRTSRLPIKNPLSLDLESEVASENAFVAQVPVQLRRVHPDHLLGDLECGIRSSGVTGFRGGHMTLCNIHGKIYHVF